MHDLLWLGVAVKLAASAGVVVIASLVAERVGPLGAAMIASLPVTAGPAYVLLALDHGPPFIAASALASLAVMPATAAFATIYPLLARRGLALGLCAALFAWSAAAVALRRIDWSLPGALAASTAAYAAGLAATRGVAGAKLAGRVLRRWWDIPARAALVAALVGVVLVIGQLLGPGAAGLAAVFPLTMCSLAMIVHPRLGWPVSAAMIANSMLGMIGFGCMLAAIAAATPVWGTPAGLLLGLVISIAWNLGILAWKRRAR